MATPFVRSPRAALLALVLALLALCGFWALLMLHTSEGNGMIRFIPLSFVAAWPIITFLGFAWIGSSVRGAVLRVVLFILILPAVLVCLLAIFAVQFHGTVYILHLRPPPRPMFHNHFVDDDRVLLPYWREDSPIMDGFGNLCFADHEDNLLVVILSRVPYAGSWGWLTTVGLYETRFQFHDEPGGRTVTVPRTKDTLIVVLPSGEQQQFGLDPTLARQFHLDRYPSNNVKNVLREAGELLASEERQAFDAFIADYREPEPKQRKHDD